MCDRFVLFIIDDAHVWKHVSLVKLGDLDSKSQFVFVAFDDLFESLDALLASWRVSIDMKLISDVL